MGPSVTILNEKSVASVQNTGFARDGATASRDQRGPQALTSLMCTPRSISVLETLLPLSGVVLQVQGCAATVRTNVPHRDRLALPRFYRSLLRTLQPCSLLNPLPSLPLPPDVPSYIIRVSRHQSRIHIVPALSRSPPIERVCTQGE